MYFVGLDMIILDVLLPSDQEYVTPPLADNVIFCTLQVRVSTDLSFITTVGKLLMFIFPKSVESSDTGHAPEAVTE